LSRELQNGLRQQEDQIRAFDAQMAEKDQEIQLLSAQVEKSGESVDVLTKQLTEITGSKAWKAGLLFRRIRLWLVPHKQRLP